MSAVSKRNKKLGRKTTQRPPSTRANPPCPFCGSIKTYVLGDRDFYCGNCRKMFDGDPDEGGDWSNRNPAARLEREERRK